jgi:hypothetical protein
MPNPRPGSFQSNSKGALVYIKNVFGRAASKVEAFSAAVEADGCLIRQMEPFPGATRKELDQDEADATDVMSRR